MAEFIMFVRGGNDAYPSMSPEEIQQAIARYSQWARDLESQGNRRFTGHRRFGGYPDL